MKKTAAICLTLLLVLSLFTGCAAGGQEKVTIRVSEVAHSVF